MRVWEVQNLKLFFNEFWSFFLHLLNTINSFLRGTILILVKLYRLNWMILEIFFAAGCFWGVEKNFESIEGVVDVVSGYSGGNYDNPTYEAVLKNRRLQNEGFLSVLKNIGLSDEEKAKNKNTLINHTETVKVVYDSSQVSTESLIKNFW